MIRAETLHGCFNHTISCRKCIMSSVKRTRCLLEIEETLRKCTEEGPYRFTTETGKRGGHKKGYIVGKAKCKERTMQSHFLTVRHSISVLRMFHFTCNGDTK